VSIPLTVGDSSDDRMDIRISTGDFPATFGGVGGNTQWLITGASGDVSDGSNHEIRLAYDTNNIQIWYDTVSAGTDASATVPTLSGTQIRLGHAPGGTNQPNCAISRLRFWSSREVP
jgi:hypothetical protein